ncbi:MAG TPA: hypothetical protein VFM45_01195 [Anaeromyxobacteraceae bacterium]|nr:hypothetical protein [Anaeromyxobacteraceae bacterium]
MKTLKVLGIVLVAAGTLGLVFGGFSYTRDSHETKLGPFSLLVKDTESVRIPTWASVGAIVVGVGLLLVPRRD